MDKHTKDKNRKADPDQKDEADQVAEDAKNTEETVAAEATGPDRNENNSEEAADNAADADLLDKETAEAEPEEETVEAADEETTEAESEEETAEAATKEEIPEEEDLTEPAAKMIEVDEEEMLFTRRKVKNLQEETRKLNNELEALKDRMLRLTAEYENYRNRTAREKEEIETESIAGVLADILPVMDNLERALISETDDLPGLKDGVQMTLDQFIVAMQKLGVELIPTDSGFDPEYHEAVMHELDETKGEKEITEVFLKGYKKGEKVVRHSVVKVVN